MAVCVSEAAASLSEPHHTHPRAGGIASPPDIFRVLRTKCVDVGRPLAETSRYIRCARRGDDANLLGVAVHMADQDPTAPVLAFFAGTDIAEGTELVRKR